MSLTLLIGVAMISSTVVIHTAGLIMLARLMALISGWFADHLHHWGKTAAMLFMVHGLFFLHGLEILVWALAFVQIGASPDIEAALYLSSVNFTTLGVGDLPIDGPWRLLAGIEGINGFLLIGWSTAYLVSASTRYGPFVIGKHF